MNIVLIGYRGTGKSTVAPALATRLDWTCVDVDREIESQAGKSIAEIFSESGETAFRDVEAQVVQQVAARQNCVIAAGGGVVLRPANRQTLRRTGFVIWLTARSECIHGRLSRDPATKDQRPNLTRVGGLQEIQHVLAERMPLYREMADHEVSTDDKPLAQVTEEVYAWLCEQDLQSART